MIDGNFDYYSKDYLWDTGCCLVCNSQSEGCWCNEVKCHECSWYEGESSQIEEYHNLEKLEGYCTFPSSNFGLPCSEDITIEVETEKAFLIKLTHINGNLNNYPSFWIPKKACIIRKENDGFEWITIKGWFILLKENEYSNKEKMTEEDESLSALFSDMIENDYID